MRPGFRIACVAALATNALAWPAARAAEVPLGELTRRMFTSYDGLPSAQVNAIAQTADGYLWLGTQAGLVRFDGVSFVAVDDPERKLIRRKDVTALLVDRGGALWVGMNGGEGLIRIQDGRFESFGPALAALPRGGSGWNSVLAIHEDRAGTLWLASWNGVMRMREGRFEAVGQIAGRAVGQVSAFGEEADGTIWFGTWQGELFRQRGPHIDRLGARDGLPGHAIRVLRVDGHGALWVGTQGAGLWRRRGDEGFRRFDAPGLPHPVVHTALIDAMGVLWVGTEGGLARVHDDGRLETLPDRSFRLPVAAIAVDREGDTWAGTSAGLLRLNQGKFGRLPSDTVVEGPDALHEDPTGAIWIGSMVGNLFRWKDGTITTLRAADGLCVDKVYGLLTDREGGLWVGGSNGPEGRVCRRDQHGFSPAAVMPPSVTPVRALHEERDGSILAGAERTYRVSAGAVEAAAVPDLGFVTVMREAPDRTLWIGGHGGVGMRGADGRWRVYRASDGLPSDTVHAIAFAGDGTVWVGTERGLARIRDGRALALRSETGLVDDQVRGVVLDATAALWLCTPRGLFRVRTQAIEAYAAGHRATIPLTPYGLDEGLPAHQCLSALRTRQGRLWFGTSAGPVWIDEQAEGRANASRLAPLIERVEADGRRIDPRRGRVAPGRGDLRIDYTAPSFQSPSRLRFRYRLDPFDREWVEAQGRRAAFYTNVPPGHYRFTVAVDQGDDESLVTSAPLMLTLAPHFHQTLPFRAAIGALVAAALFALYRYRLARLAAAHAAILEERTRIARELHDTLAQGFTGITIQVASALDRLDSDPGQARQNLRQADLLARTSLAETQRVVWDLRAEASAAGTLSDALRAIARRLDTGARIEVHASGVERRLPALKESALLRIGQEALTNAVRHAQAHRIDLFLEYADASVRLRVVDDGRGFDAVGAPRPAGHFGLQGIGERVEILRGTMQLDTRPGAGTTLSVEIPVPRGSDS